MACKEQAEEYRLGLEEERKSHERTKANVQSMNLQWKTMYESLQAKQKEVISVNSAKRCDHYKRSL